MDKKVILMAIIVICVSSLVYLAVSGEQSITKPPPLPVRGSGPDMSMPPGHPTTDGSDMRKIAPDFTLMALDGRKYQLSGLKGKAVIINFWSSSCAPCIMEMPTFTILDQKMAGKDFEILSITSDMRETAARTVKSYGITIPVLIDTEGRVPLKFGVYYTPETFIIAPDGTIDQKIMGAVNWGDDSVVSYLDDLIASHAAPKEKEADEKPLEKIDHVKEEKEKTP